MNKRISVIIPAFNAEATLAETLDSVKEQTLKPNEVIVINDGSSDNTGKIALHHPVKPVLIDTVQQGTPDALNTGIRESSGDLLAFIDADDLWEPDKLQLQYESLRYQGREHVSLSYVEAFVCPDVDRLNINTLQYKKGPQPGFLLGTLLCHRQVFEHYGMMDSRLKTGYFIDWFDRAKTGGMEYIMLPDVLLRRRIRPGTLSQRSSQSGGLSSDFVEIARRSILRKRHIQEPND